MKKNVLLTIILVLCASFTFAQTPESYGFNVKAGGLFSGTVNVEGFEVDTKMSPIFKAEFDGILVPKLSMGAYLLFSPVGIKDIDEKFNTLSIGFTIKPRFTVNESVQIRPGLAVGYNRINNDDVMGDPSKGLNVGFQFEVMKPINEKTGVVGELGFFSQPAGGNEDADVTFAPIVYLMVGIELFK